MLNIKSKAFAGLVVALALAVGVNFASADMINIPTTGVKKTSGMENIKNLQSFLNWTLGTSITPLVVDGKWGAKTTAAIKAYQKANGLTADGLFGKLSAAKAIALMAGGSTTGTTTTGTTTTQTGPITAMLATDNPASGTIVAGQATADLMKVTFNGTGTVNSVTLQRSGVSDQNTLTGVYLYDGVKRLTDGYTFNTNGTLTINNLNLMVNGSKTISVKADVSSSTTSYNIIVTLTSFSAGTSVNTVAIKSNDMFIAGSGSLATISLSGSNTVSSATVNAGTTGYTVWRQSVQANTRALWLKAANFRITGSAPSDALSNVGFYVDGVKAGNNATMTMTNGSNYLSFDMTANPVSISTGSHLFEVRADITKGSSYNFIVALQQASDIMVTDPQVGVNLAVCGSPSCPTSFSASTSGTITIGTGSFTATTDPTFSTFTNVTAGSSNVTIAKFKIRGYGEDIKVTSLPITTVLTTPTPTSNGLQNLTLYFNGSQVGTQTTQTAIGTTTFNLGSQMIIPAGQDSTLEVRADLRTQAGVNYTAGSISANLGAATAEGWSSKASITGPTSTGNTLTMQSGTLGLSKNSGYSNQNVNPNTAGVKVGSFVLQNQSTSESIRVTSLAVALAFATPTYTSGTVTAGSQSVTFSSTSGMLVGNTITIPGATAAIGTITSITSGTVAVVNFTTGGVTPTVGGAVTGSGSTVGPAALANLSGLRTSETSGSGATPIQPAASNTFSVDFTLAPGTTKTVDIFADSGNANFGNVVSTLTVTSIGVTSNISATSSATAGQTIGFAAGTLGTPTIVSSSSTPAQLVAAAVSGSTDGSVAVFNVVSANAGSTVTELTFSVTSGTATSVRVGNVTAPVVGTTAYLTGLNIAVPNGGSGATISAYVSYPIVGSSGVASNTSSTLTLTTIKSTSGNTTTTSTVSVAAPTMTLIGSKPVVTVNTANVSGLNMGAENKIGEVTVSADAKGDIKINDIKFNVANVGFTTVPTFTLARIADGTTTITGSSCGQGVAAAASQIIFCEFGTVGNTFTTTTGTASVEVNTDFDGYTIPAGTSKTFSLFATVAAANTGTNLAQISTSVDAAGFNWDDTSTAQFVADASAASPSAGTNLAGSLIYNFPTGSYTIKQ